LKDSGASDQASCHDAVASRSFRLFHRSQGIQIGPLLDSADRTLCGGPR
jgi:hypothetical protein